MDLRSWLQETAGLSGRALVVTTKACEDNFIESLADLRLAQSQPTEMDKIFPQGLIRLKISAALEDDGAVDDAAEHARYGGHVAGHGQRSELRHARLQLWGARVQRRPDDADANVQPSAVQPGLRADQAYYAVWARRLLRRQLSRTKESSHRGADRSATAI